MTIKMKKEVFNSLAIDAVGHACFEPMIPAYQQSMMNSGEETAVHRAEFYKTLTPGQRALMFFTYYDHAIRSEEEFRRISFHYLTAHIFGIVKKAAEYFGDQDLSRLLAKLENTFSENDQSTAQGLYQQFQEISPQTLAIIGARVKENPAEFVCLE